MGRGSRTLLGHCMAAGEGAIACGRGEVAGRRRD